MSSVLLYSDYILSLQLLWAFLIKYNVKHVENRRNSFHKPNSRIWLQISKGTAYRQYLSDPKVIQGLRETKQFVGDEVLDINHVIATMEKDCPLQSLVACCKFGEPIKDSEAASDLYQWANFPKKYRNHMPVQQCMPLKNPIRNVPGNVMPLPVTDTSMLRRLAESLNQGSAHEMTLNTVMLRILSL